LYESIDVVGPPKKCLGKNQRPMGGVTPAKKVQIHDPQKEKPAKAAPFEALSARKSSPLVFSGRILFLSVLYLMFFSDCLLHLFQSIRGNMGMYITHITVFGF